MRCASFVVVAFFALLLSLLPSPVRATGEFDPDIVDLIVLLEPDGAEIILPEDVLDLVESANDAATASMTADDWALFTRLGSPVAARWLIELRLSDEYLADLRKLDPDHPEAKLQEFVLLRYSDASGRANAQERLKGDSSVSSVAVNTRGGFSLRTNDTYVVSGLGASPGGYQWALDTLGAMSPVSNPSQTSAWDKATGFGYVAIVDSGILPSHPDLQQNFKAHFSQSFYSGGCSGSLVDVDESGASSNCPNGPRGHGTHIAGIIAARANNNSGVAGLCWDCSLIVAKTYSSNNPQAADRINGYNHAAMRGAQFVNLSGHDNQYFWSGWGGSIDSCEELGQQASQDAYCNALALLNLREVMFVAASGNDNRITGPADFPDGVDFPARDSRSISVAATKSTGQIWYLEANGSDPSIGSNLGTSQKSVDFVAPGAEIVSAFYTANTWSNLWSDPWKCRDSPIANGYDKCTGTSMAAPHVLGVAAVARSINPLLTVAALKTLLTSTSTNVTPPSGVNPPGGSFKQPNMLNAVNSAIANGSTWPAFAMVTKFSSSNRFTTAIPQMARAAIAGTMLPTPIPSGAVVYMPDPSAPVVVGYPAFPDWGAAPRAYFKVYTKLKASSTNLKPLYRLSKLQNLGSGTDACGTPMPVPSKPEPVIHFYTTSKSERDALIAATYGNCFKYDGIEGYVAPSDLGGLQQLFRIYNPAADAWILVPSSHLTTANTLGYTQQQTSLGWVVPN